MSKALNVIDVICRDRADAQQYRSIYLPERLEIGKYESELAVAAIKNLIECAERVSSHGVRSSYMIYKDWDNLRAAINAVNGGPQ